MVMLCIAKEENTGIKIIVNNDSFEVTVCDQSGKYSNGFDAVFSSQSLFAMIDDKFKTMIISKETLKWLGSYKSMVESIDNERINDNKVKLLSGGGHDYENKLKEYGWTNKKLNDVYIKADRRSNG